MSTIKDLLGAGGKALGGLADKVLQQQSDTNRTEVSSAPPSRLRLWRGFLGWALSLAFVWEACIRPIVLHYVPEADLPPSMVKEISSLLLGMLGLGF